MTEDTNMICDTCHKPVRIVADGVHVGAFGHADDPNNANAQFCETDSGYVRVTVNGEKADPTRTAARRI